MTTPMTDNARIDADALEIAWTACLTAVVHSDSITRRAFKAGVAAYLGALARRSIQDQPEAEAAGWFWRWASSDEWRRFGTSSSEAARADFIRDQERIAPVVVAQLFASAPPPIAGAGWNGETVKMVAKIIAGPDADKPYNGRVTMEPMPKWELYEPMARKIVAALASPVPDNTDARGAQVKSLEWSLRTDQSDNQDEEAETPFGGYVITTDPFTYSPAPTYYVDGPNWFKGQYASVPDAKAAAQADYATRILSALE